MKTTKTEKADEEVRALIEFEQLINKPVPYFRWYDKAGPEPDEFRAWRLEASLLYRIKLWFQAGLPDDDNLRTLMKVTRLRERRAYARWLKVKKQISADVRAGLRKTKPPWGLGGLK